MSQVGLRVNEVCKLDLADVKWDLGRFGKLHVRHGKGARGSGPRERMVPLINNAGQTLRWFVEDVWGHFGDDHTRPGVPLLPSERKNRLRRDRRQGHRRDLAGGAGQGRGHAPAGLARRRQSVPGTHIEDAWISGQHRAAARLKGLIS
jgi:site-specific recombinase XerD